MRTSSFWNVAAIAALLCAMAASGPALGQSTEVLPPANDGVNGGNGNSIPLGASPGGTYVVLYDPSQLVGLPIGGKITSLQLRARNAEVAPWPPANAVIADYEIRLGTSTRTAATISTTFADNISGGVLVRDGALNLAANAYPGGAASGSTPEEWGPVISFSTPYTYTGGPLVIEFRNTGVAPNFHFADAATAAIGSAAIGSTTSPTATSGGSALPVVVRLSVTPPNTQAVTLPNANDTVAGNGQNSIPIGAFSDGRHMTLYAASQLASVPPGSIITGMQLRLSNTESSPWPGADSTNTDYEITLSQSPLTPGTISTTYANNQTNPVLVRDGSFDLSAGAYPAGANAGAVPEGWGPFIGFETPYVYKGGALAIDIKSVGGIAPAKFGDTAISDPSAAGVSAAPRTSATGGSASAFIVRLSYVPPVESPFGEGVTKIYALKQFADTPASTFQSVLTQNFDRTAQFLFGPEQFQTVGPGTLLTGVAFRNSSTTAWPPALGSFPQFDIRLSKSPLTPATMSTTVASNSGTDAITVRSGSLAIAAGEMAAKPTTGTAAFTWEVPFSNPYSYRFGTLDMLINRQAIGGVAGAVDAFRASDVSLQPFGRGKHTTGNAAVTLTIDSNVPITRYSTDAQVIVPNSAKDGTGLGLNYFVNSPYDGLDSTIQYVLAGSELSYIPVGGLITSLSFLAETSQGAWPGAAGAAAEDFSVEISTAANRPLNASTTFADNTGSDARIVRSGPISWLPAALPAGSTGKYGGTITFDRAFVYTGGDLCITVRHSGVTNGGPSLRAANPAALTRVVRNDGKTATVGSFFGVDGGAAIQLGYIPSGVSPKNVLAANGNGGRFAFGGTRAYQMIYNADQVGVPVGATINGVSFRLENTVASAFPAADLTLDRFDITMSSATNSAATMSDTFASNEGADVTTVRSGPITIPAASYPPNADGGRRFGLFIPFTRPFVYKGGPITMLLRNGNTSGSNPNVDFDAHSGGANGRRDTSSADAISGEDVLNAIIARFAFTDDAFCPWDLNNDGFVTDDDFQIFVLSYNILDCSDAGMALGCPGDFTFDRIVNDDDFLPFVQAYNAVLCP